MGGAADDQERLVAPDVEVLEHIIIWCRRRASWMVDADRVHGAPPPGDGGDMTPRFAPAKRWRRTPRGRSHSYPAPVTRRDLI